MCRHPATEPFDAAVVVVAHSADAEIPNMVGRAFRKEKPMNNWFALVRTEPARGARS